MAGDPLGPPEGDGVPQKTDPFRREGVELPRGGDLIRQLVVVAVVLIVWGGTFRFAMNLPTGGEGTAAAEHAEARRDARRAAAGADSTLDTPAEDGAKDGAIAPAVDGAVASGTVPAAAGAESLPARRPGADRLAEEEAAAGTTEAAAPPTEAAAPRPSPTPSTPPPSAPADPIRAISEQEAAAASTLPDISEVGAVSFAADVMPILEDRCLNCHGGVRDDGTLRIEEGLDLRSWEAIMAGSTWGSVVEPGDPAGSYLLELVLDGDMPDEGPRLLPREERILAAWIARGAEKN